MSESTNSLPSTPMSIDQSFDLDVNSRLNDLFINDLDQLNIDDTKNIFPSINNTQIYLRLFLKKKSKKSKRNSMKIFIQKTFSIWKAKPKAKKKSRKFLLLT